MLSTRYGPLFLAGVVALLAGCGGSSSTGAVAPASPTSAQVMAVAHEIWSGPGGNPCHSETIATCPVTPKLAARIKVMETPPANGGRPNSWCRCQNAGDVVITSDVTPTGGTAHVDFSNGVKVDFDMVEQSGSLLVDDTQCTGRGASTSIYVDPLVLCG